MPASARDLAPVWSTVFRRSRIGDYAVVAADRRGDVLTVLRDLGVPSVVRAPMFDTRTEAWPLLVGAVVDVQAYGFYGPRSGLRVYGAQPLAVLIEALGLRGPTRALSLRGGTLPDISAARDAFLRLPPDAALRFTATSLRLWPDMATAAEAVATHDDPTPRGGRERRAFYVTPR